MFDPFRRSRIVILRAKLRESADPTIVHQSAIEAHTLASARRRSHLADAIDAYELAVALDGKTARTMALANLRTSALRALPVVTA